MTPSVRLPRPVIYIPRSPEHVMTPSLAYQSHRPKLTGVIRGLSPVVDWDVNNCAPQADDTPCIRVPDSTGQHRHLLWSGANSELAPSYRVNAQNGLPAIEWKGVTKTWLACRNQNAHAWGIGPSFLVISIMKPSVNTNARYIFYMYGALALNNIFGILPYFNDGNGYLYTGNNSANGTGSGASALSTSWHVHTAWRDNINCGMDRNGTNLFTVGAMATQMVSEVQDCWFGADGSTSSVNTSWIGQFGRVIILNRYPGKAMHARIVQAAMDDWGL